MKNFWIVYVAFFMLIAFCVWYTDRASCLWALVLVGNFYRKPKNKAKTEQEFAQYNEGFKKLLVKRYFWTVTDAYQYTNPQLRDCFNKQLPIQEAYYKLFNVEQDMVSRSSTD